MGVSPNEQLIDKLFSLPKHTPNSPEESTKVIKITNSKLEKSVPQDNSKNVRLNINKKIFSGLKNWLAVIPAEAYEAESLSAKVFGRYWWLLNEAKDVRKVLIDDSEQFPKASTTTWLLGLLVGDSAFSSNGETWKKNRPPINEALQTANLQKVFPKMQASVLFVLNEIDLISSNSDGEVILDADKWMTRITADVIVNAIYSEHLKQEDATILYRSFSNFQAKGSIFGILHSIGISDLFMTPFLLGDVKQIREWHKLHIQARLSSRKERVGENSDILESLIATNHFDIEGLVDSVTMLFLAGHETSAATLAIACYLLSQNLSVQDRLIEEIELARSNDDSSPLVSYEFLKKVPYCNFIIQETLRLYPPIPFLFRESNKDTELRKTGCPIKSQIIISPWIMHRLRSIWTKPEAFDPARFETLNSSTYRENYLPFGMGPRKCPGAAFAMLESQLVLINLLGRYKLLPVEGFKPKIAGRLTIRSLNGMQVRLKIRK